MYKSPSPSKKGFKNRTTNFTPLKKMPTTPMAVGKHNRSASKNMISPIKIGSDLKKQKSGATSPN